MPPTGIEYLTSYDQLGRCRFFLTWDENGKKRSQVFFARPEDYGHSGAY
tara:strand:+ start:738 stop:884 length:147 start_codon:yes stop_codon:yes gene_type:complete